MTTTHPRPAVDEPRVWIGCLACYNEGRLRGDWFSAAEAADILVPSGCRMGICYGCVLPLRSGAVRDMRTGEVTSGTDGDGVMVQTCISSAAGDCTIGR